MFVPKIVLSRPACDLCPLRWWQTLKHPIGCIVTLFVGADLESVLLCVRRKALDCVVIVMALQHSGQQAYKVGGLHLSI